jgi:hypothetical protein
VGLGGPWSIALRVTLVAVQLALPATPSDGSEVVGNVKSRERVPQPGQRLSSAARIGSGGLNSPTDMEMCRFRKVGELAPPTFI